MHGAECIGSAQERARGIDFEPIAFVFTERLNGFRFGADADKKSWLSGLGNCEPLAQSGDRAFHAGLDDAVFFERDSERAEFETPLTGANGGWDRHDAPLRRECRGEQEKSENGPRHLFPSYTLEACHSRLRDARFNPGF